MLKDDPQQWREAREYVLEEQVADGFGWEPTDLELFFADGLIDAEGKVLYTNTTDNQKVVRLGLPFKVEAPQGLAFFMEFRDGSPFYLLPGRIDGLLIQGTFSV